MDIPRFNPREFVAGLGEPFRGMAFLMRHRGLKRYAALPLLVNMLVYVLVLVLVFRLIGEWRIGEVSWDFWWSLGSWLSSLVNGLLGGVKVLAGVAAVMFAFLTFTAVGLVMAAPLNDILSGKVEAEHCGPGKRPDLSLGFTARAALLAFYDSLRNLAGQIVWSAACLPFLLVPVIGFLPLFLVGSYFSGFGFLDCAMARNHLRPRHKRLLSRRRFWRIVGFGAAMQMLFFIPLAGLLLLPVGVTAGTLVYCENDWKELFARSGMVAPPGFTPPERDRRDA